MYTGCTPKYSRWIVGAVDCYNRHCICAGCPTYELIGKQCQMKYAVIKLVEQLGKPSEENNEMTSQQDEFRYDKTISLLNKTARLQNSTTARPLKDSQSRSHTVLQTNQRNELNDSTS